MGSISIKDIATIHAKQLKLQGKLNDYEIIDEIKKHYGILLTPEDFQ